MVSAICEMVAVGVIIITHCVAQRKRIVARFCGNHQGNLYNYDITFPHTQYNIVLDRYITIIDKCFSRNTETLTGRKT